ncbi:substrate-binding domain-containing protein [Streptomyces sp. Lzd4kr]|nr:substrate-binding domain-containing protein [Streptomyces sp. Lzd4kr]
MAALSLAFSMSAACGQEGSSGGSGGESLRVGLLLPDTQAVRYEEFDKPFIEEKVEERCSGCTVEYANAEGDAAAQQQQLDSMLTKGVDVLILDPVNSPSLGPSVTKAADAGVPVVSYDRLVEGPVSAYVSYDREAVGRIQGEALLQDLGDSAADSQIVWIEGPHITPGASAREKGALEVLEGEVRIGKRYEAAAWRAENANAIMTGAIAHLGADNIDGVYAGNDTLAGGAISALKNAKIEPVPPVTGQDAELLAVQRIVAGDQAASEPFPTSG